LKEILFFVENGLFGSECVSIQQSISMVDGTIKNSLIFSSDREFLVDGKLSFVVIIILLLRA